MVSNLSRNSDWRRLLPRTLGKCGDQSEAKIGKNCNIAQGVTIAQANRGKNEGVQDGNRR